MLLYLGSLFVLVVYSILYGLTAKEEHWLGAITSVAVIILGDLVNSLCYLLYIFFTLTENSCALFSSVYLICFIFYICALVL